MVDDECISYKEYIDEIKGNLRGFKEGYPILIFQENGFCKRRPTEDFCEKERLSLVLDERIRHFIHATDEDDKNG